MEYDSNPRCVRCGHLKARHEHYRVGTECSFRTLYAGDKEKDFPYYVSCDCGRFVNPRSLSSIIRWWFST